MAIRSLFTFSSWITIVIALSISSSSIGPIGSAKRSFAEFERSRSCHDIIFSIDTLTSDRSILASENTRSLFIGFRLTGTALPSHLAFPERLGYFTYLCPLQIPDLYSDLVKRGANKCNTKLYLCKSLSRHNLRCSIYRVETKLLSNNFFVLRAPCHPLTSQYRLHQASCTEESAFCLP